jgi:hypothetical protein
MENTHQQKYEHYLLLIGVHFSVKQRSGGENGEKKKTYVIRADPIRPDFSHPIYAFL